MSAVIEAPVFPCASCGVPLAIEPAAGQAACRHCRAVTPVPDAVREAARAYNRAIAREAARASFAEKFARGDGLDRVIGAFVALLIALSLAFTVLQALPAFVRVDPLAREYGLPAFLVLVALSVGALLVAIPVVLLRGERPDENATVVPAFSGGVQAVCAHCGAPVSFRVGSTEALCAHCRRPVQATAGHQRALIALAGEQADLASARAVRAPQRAFAGRGATVGWGIFDAIMFAVRWLMPGGILITVGASLFSASTGDPTRDALALTGAALVASGVVFVALAVGITALVRRLSRGQRLRRALFAAQPFARGRLGSGALSVLDWLDAHWAADVPHAVITSENSGDGKSIVRWSLAFTFEGRPTLVVAAHAPHVKRIDLFLSSYRRRGAEAASALASPAADELRRAGFEVALSNGGVHCSRSDSDPAPLETERLRWALSRASALA